MAAFKNGTKLSIGRSGKWEDYIELLLYNVLKALIDTPFYLHIVFSK